VIFQNFGSKAALFAAVVDRVAGDVQAELERLAGQPGSAAGLLAHALEPGHPHLHAHGFGAHGVLFSDAFALIGEPELTEAARRAARTIADHLADLIRRGQADGDIRADTDPGPAAWLLLSVLSTRAFRTAVAPDHERVEDGITALALQFLDPGMTGTGAG
jgi:AcrR family transcriptional regulator